MWLRYVATTQYGLVGPCREKRSMGTASRAKYVRSRDGGTSPCVNAGEPLLLAPGTNGAFSELLSGDLISGPVRPLHYFLKVENSDGRSTGLLTGVVTVAGAAPSPVRNLTVKLIQQTAQLCWAPAGTKAEDGDVVRIFRTVLPKEGIQQGQPESDKPPPPSQGESFDVDSSLTCAVDKSFRTGDNYKYRAQRVARITVDGRVIELPGFLSNPVRLGNVSMGPA